jgi:5-methylcytosine-specific restriction protein A
VERGRCSSCAGTGSAADGRQSSAERGYGPRWQKTRKGYLAAHPFCTDPHGEHKGQQVLANELDHIVPHKGDMKLFWTRSNWQGLCKPCHSRKTASEGGFGNSYRYGH